MNEMRYDPLKDRWIAMSPKRMKRPHLPKSFCPFCPGAPEVPDANWTVKWLPNKFPTLMLEGADEVPLREDGFYKTRPAIGKCEVILYSPDHNADMKDLPLEHVIEVVKLWQNRYAEIGKDPRISYVAIFENRGREIGVSLDHPHGQIYAFSHVPHLIREELKNARKFYDLHGKCIFCDIASRESASGERIVYKNDSFIVFVPYWARFPYETRVLPVRHVESIVDFTEKEVRDFADALIKIRKAYDALFGIKMAFMMIFHQAPTDGKKYPHYHFHVEFIAVHRARDKLKQPAGIEWGTDFFSNPSLPEESAKKLKEALLRATGGESQ